ncbi:MAG: hypothetical protein VKP62_10450 [Candidatus Sericytochromatia bacterium]|nr:hypothetical protein [Candidatus Sericytochromatia bacterium]
MASCIYDDSPAVSVCSGCDFGVCQACLDQGEDGVCRTCSEERAHRRTSSAVQREYEAPTASSRRCNYCRAAEDEQTHLDDEGYCDACRALPRCISHADLVAVGHCKSCRREFCRKCLGFTDVCQSCQAKPKTRPLNERSAPDAARSGKSNKKAKKTSPIDGAPAAKGGAGKGAKGAAPANAASDKRNRGRNAIQERLKTQNAPQSRARMVTLAVVVAGFLLLLASGTYMHAMSPEAQEDKLREQVQTVHRAVFEHYSESRQLPRTADEVTRVLLARNVKNARRIRIAGEEARIPNAVVYECNPAGTHFLVQARDRDGRWLLSPGEVPYALTDRENPIPE